MRKQFFIFAFFFLVSHLTFDVSPVYSQQPTQEWVARYTGPSNDGYGPFLQVDKAGNSYIAGTHVIGQYPNDSICILCVKYNSSGVQLWANLYRYPGEGYFAPSGLALDSSGNAYVIADYGPTYTVPLNGLIVKFNSLNGSAVWARTYSGEFGWSAFRDIKMDRLNNIYVVGWTDTSHLVIRYNMNGDSVWVRKYHPPSCREVSRACTIDDSLNIIFTGQRMHYYPPFGSLDSVLVTKYSSGGVLRWESLYANGIEANLGTKIVADQNGSLYIGGVNSISGHAVYLTMKYDLNGAQQWAQIYDAPGNGDNNLKGMVMDRINNALIVTGGANVNGNLKAATIKYNITTGDSVWVRTDTGNYRHGNSQDIALDTSGNIYITGQTNNIPPGSDVDFLTVKYSLQGNRIWFATYNGPYNGWDGGISLGLDNSNNLYVLGSSQSNFQLSDYVVIKYNQLLGIRPISSEIPLVFSLGQNYPNPFNPLTKIKFSIAKSSFVQLKIYNILGQLKDMLVNQKLHASEYEFSLDASDYPSGVFFYQLIADGNIVSTKKMLLIK